MNLLVSVAGTTLTADDRELLSKPYIAGVVIFQENIVSATQLTKLIQDIKQIKITSPLQISIDHEGGIINRFIKRDNAQPLWQHTTAPIPIALKSARHYNALFKQNADKGIETFRQDCEHDAKILSTFGIDVVYGPCIDWDNPDCPIISQYDRAYGNDSDTILALAKAYVSSFRQHGLTTCLKHFPGHGDTRSDSHLGLPIDKRDQATIARDFSLYQNLINQGLADQIMLAHMHSPPLCGDTITSLSATLVKQLRSMQHAGVIVTDCLAMKALNGIPPLDRLKLATAAGADQVMLTHQNPQQLLQLLENSATMTLAQNNQVTNT